MDFGRFEWLSIPREESGEVGEAETNAFPAKKCPSCGWVDSQSRFERLADEGGVRECWRCGVRWDLSDEVNAFFQEEQVQLPPVKVEHTTEILKPFCFSGKAEPRLFDLHLQAERFALRKGFDHLLCLGSAKIERLEYQVKTAQAVLQKMKIRALLADEVGLGKTIEAGLVISETLLRGIAGNVLVLAPAGLVFQWQQELKDKFGLEFEVLKRHQKARESLLLISSYDRAKRGKCAETLLARSWDILVLDEAQRLKHRTTALWKFVKKLNSRFVVCLSATPVENDLTEIFSILDIVKPGSLGTIRAFKRAFVSPSDSRKPAAGKESVLRELLSDIMIRNRRDTCGLRLPRRRAGIYHIDLSPVEKELYNHVTDWVKKRFKKEFLLETGMKTHVLSLMVLQREVVSSPAALRKTLLRIAERKNYPPSITNRLKQFAEMAKKVETPSKIVALRDIFQKFGGQRFVVFSEFVESVQVIAQSVRKWGLPAFTLSGRDTPAKRYEALKAFGETPGAALVCTDVGGVGLNLQAACHHLVNYDLPWNPMKLEQRIGRCDRIGQENEVVIFNLCTRGTIEEHIMDIIGKKIRMFELIVGEMNTILESIHPERTFPQLIFDAWSGSSSREEEALAFSELGERAAEARARYSETVGANRFLDRIGGVG